MAQASGVEIGVRARRGQTNRLARLARVAQRKPLGSISFLVILAMVIMAIAAPLVAPHDPNELRPSARLQAPNTTFLLGTDQVGRDVLSRLIYGARVSIWVGIMAIVIGTGSGVVIGLVSGFAGGKLDLIVQRVVDAVLAFPGLILALVLVTVLGPGLEKLFIAVGVSIAPGQSRVVRSAVLSIKENVYVEAGRAVGATNTRLLLKYLLPNVMPIIIVLASLLLGAAILIEAGLSFLGLGVQPPTPSWGNMLSAEGRRYMELAPWMAVFPGACIMLVVLAFNLFGDMLRDILDPRLRGSR